MGGLNRSIFCVACKAWIAEGDLESHITSHPTHALLRYHHALPQGDTDPPDGRIDDLVVVTAGRNSPVVTDRYLEGSGQVPMNVSGLVVPVDAHIVALSGACAASATWTAEVHKNGLGVAIASLAFVAARTASSVMAPAVNVNAGDELQVYCNGTAAYPYIAVTLRPRYDDEIRG